jgi:ABC-type oligopeptide transport system substrate-binding subunit
LPDRISEEHENDRYRPRLLCSTDRLARPDRHEIYFDAEIEPVDTTQWFPRLTRRDYPFALSLTGSGLDDPDSNFYIGYTCGAEENFNGYCNPEVDKMIDRQSLEMRE